MKVLEALGANDTPEALPVVRAALDDPDLDVKYAATLSLIELQSDLSFPEVADLIEQTTGTVREQIVRGFFHATNYLALDVAQTASADIVLDALENALLDPLPAARLAAVWPLAWMRHPRAPEILKYAYQTEPDPETKARMVKIAYNLMSEAREEILADAAQSNVPTVKEAAEQIRIMRSG